MSRARSRFSRELRGRAGKADERADLEVSWNRATISKRVERFSMPGESFLRIIFKENVNDPPKWPADRSRRWDRMVPVRRSIRKLVYHSSVIHSHIAEGLYREIFPASNVYGRDKLDSKASTRGIKRHIALHFSINASLYVKILFFFMNRARDGNLQ